MQVARELRNNLYKHWTPISIRCSIRNAIVRDQRYAHLIECVINCIIKNTVLYHNSVTAWYSQGM